MIFQALISIFAFSWMFINLLLSLKVHICGLTLSNLNVCDTPVSLQPSYWAAPAHIIDFYVHWDSGALSAWAPIIKEVPQALNFGFQWSTNSVKEY